MSPDRRFDSAGAHPSGMNKLFRLDVLCFSIRLRIPWER